MYIYIQKIVLNNAKQITNLTYRQRICWENVKLFLPVLQNPSRIQKKDLIENACKKYLK